MVELLKGLPPSVLLSFTAGLLALFYALIKVAAWFFTDWWADRKKSKEEQVSALTKNTLAIVELQVQIKQLNEFLHIIPKLRNDVDLAHRFIREIKENP